MTLSTVDGMTIHFIENGDELRFHGHEHRDVVCNVHGGNPAPIFHVMAGDIDITDQFTVTKRMLTEETATEGLVILRSSITARANILPMKGIYSGMRFQCVAKSVLESVESVTVGFVAKLKWRKLFVWSWECFH